MHLTHFMIFNNKYRLRSCNSNRKANVFKKWTFITILMIYNVWKKKASIKTSLYCVLFIYFRDWTSYVINQSSIFDMEELKKVNALAASVPRQSSLAFKSTASSILSSLEKIQRESLAGNEPVYSKQNLCDVAEVNHRKPVDLQQILYTTCLL
jgi:hypothetical protein